VAEDCADVLPQLDAGAGQLDIALSKRQQQQFLDYCELLQAWSAHTNLTAVKTPEGIIRTLFLDSLSLVPTVRSLSGEAAALRAIDIGAGAGFPSLPLKIVFPGWTLALVESVGKKTRFLSTAVEALGLSGVTVHNRRAEEMGRDAEYREAFDLALARAVSALPSLLELCAPLVRVGGYCIFPKSGRVEREITSAAEAARRVGARVLRADVVDPALQLGENRRVVVYVKERPTPSGYPRRTGLAQSRPIGS
jgi:16S rRNA (guanine527-N7)-methyltransferase